MLVPPSAQFLQQNLPPGRISASQECDTCNLLLVSKKLFFSLYTTKILIMVSTAVSEITAPSAFNHGNACDCPASPNTAENCNNLACKKAIAQIAILRKWKNAEEIPRGALSAIFHTSSHDTDHKMTITTLKEFVKLEDTNEVQGAGLFWRTQGKTTTSTGKMTPHTAA